MVRAPKETDTGLVPSDVTTWAITELLVAAPTSSRPAPTFSASTLSPQLSPSDCGILDGRIHQQGLDLRGRVSGMELHQQRGCAGHHGRGKARAGGRNVAVGAVHGAGLVEALGRHVHAIGAEEEVVLQGRVGGV